MTSGESDWRIRLAIWYRLLWISLAPLATILLHFTTQLVFVFDYEQEALLRVRELFRVSGQYVSISFRNERDQNDFICGIH